MFETTLAWGPGYRRGTWLLSTSAHAVLAGAVLVAPLLAVEDPPEPDTKIGAWVLERPRVLIVDAPVGERRPAPRKGRESGASRGPRPALGPSVASQPTGIPQEVPVAPDTASPGSTEGEADSRSRVEGSPESEGDGDGEGAGDVTGFGPVDARAPDVTPPVPILAPPPPYPEAARIARLEGTVRLRAVIGSDGRVRDVDVAGSPNPLLARAAREAVRGWVYRPARLGVRAVSVFLDVTIDFRLH